MLCSCWCWPFSLSPREPRHQFHNTDHLLSQITTCKLYTESIESCWSSEHSVGYRGRVLKCWCYSLIHHLFFSYSPLIVLALSPSYQDNRGSLHKRQVNFETKQKRSGQVEWNMINTFFFFFFIPCCVHGFLPRMVLRLICFSPSSSSLQNNCDMLCIPRRYKRSFHHLSVGSYLWEAGEMY